MIVSDAGPLIAFARINRLSLLQQVVDHILIPDAVYVEVARSDRGRPGAMDVENEPWIERRTVSITGRAFPARLGLGEREAMLLAEAEQLPFLIDDREAREEAIRRGMSVVGSLWVIGQAKHRGLINAVKPLMTDLISNGYRMHPERIIRPFLEEMGEYS